MAFGRARRYLLLVLMVVVAGCSGAAKPAPQQQETSAPEATALLLARALPPLPAGREASAARVTEINGRFTFDRSLNALDNGTALDLISSLSDVSWGIWQFNPWLQSIEAVQVVMTVPDGDEAYVAISDYGQGAWSFEGPLTAGKSVALDDALHRSPTGNMYLAVAALGGDRPTVHKLILTTDDGWVIVTVDDSYNVGRYTSLAVIDGRPAISYTDMYKMDLKYAASTTATGSNASDWSLTTVDTTDYMGTHTSLAAVEGQPAISYRDDSNHALKYTRRTADDPPSWPTVTVDTSDIGEDVGFYTSLAVVNGYPLITYFDAGNGYLMHAVSVTTLGVNEADWQVYVTDNGDDAVGMYNSLAVVDGKAAVSYGVDYFVPSLRYKWFSDPAKVSVALPLGQALFTSLAVVDGKPAISWYESGTNTLNYSYSTTARGTSNLDWHTIAIPSFEIAGTYSSLEVIDGRPAIGYQIHNVSPDGLWLAFSWSSTAEGRNPSDWNTIVVDDYAESTGHHASLAEVDGKPAISYYEEDNHCLKYAIRMGP